MAKPNLKILDAFRDRLLSAINRSPLLKVRTDKTARFLDCSRLDGLEGGLGRQLLTAVVDGDHPVSIDLPWRLAAALETDAPEAEEPLFRASGDSHDLRTATEQKLVEQALKRICRFGALAKRETGIHSIWLGYPLLYVAIAGTDPVQYLLAPAFLWPVTVEPTRRVQGRYVISRASEAGPPQFNRAMAAWVENKLEFEVSAPDDETQEGLCWESLPGLLRNIAGGFQPSPAIECGGHLEKIPAATALNPQKSPCYFNSAVLGNFRWQNESILADLEAIKDLPDCQAPAAGFITGASLDLPREVPPEPAESDRFLVSDADFSQERAIWKARGKAGLVVHGPPGTGKSQTIVNLIADALAHDKTVLMVCQKQAATRVVLERLRKSGLDTLCMEVHDPESERAAVFSEIRAQAETLPNAAPSAKAEAQREQLAAEIGTLKQELDLIARGLNEGLPEIGLRYTDVKAREGHVFQNHPTARPLPFLQSAIGVMSEAALKELCRHVEAVGQWFREGDPFNNPWRDHVTALQPNPRTERDFHEVLGQLRKADAAHADQVREHGAGWPLPDGCSAFAPAAQDLIERVRAIAKSPRDPEAGLIRCWLTAIRSEASSRTERHVERCGHAVALASQVREAPLDPEWEQYCSTVPADDLESLRHHAECLLRHLGHWWAFPLPSFRRSRQSLRAQFPKESAESLVDKAAGLLEHLKARDMRAELAQANHKLVPGAESRHLDAVAPTRFPQLARDCLESAIWLRRQELAYPSFASVLDEINVARSTKLGHELEQLERTVRRVEPANAVLQHLAGLEAYLRQEALERVRAEVLAGRSIQSWLDGLAAGFNGLRSLLRWEMDREQREEPQRAVLDCLEQYERRRAKGEPLPAPAGDLGGDEYGRWWAALVRAAAVTTWLAVFEKKHPQLIDFNPEQHEQRRQRLRRLLSEMRALEAKVIQERWLARQVPLRDRPWNKWFRDAGRNAQRLRQAVSASPLDLLTLRPVWLVDPGTAAQIFPLEPGLFDLVIFDEASQCPIEYAVPAIFRGKALIVSGDAKQLPPTHFFSAKAQADDVDEEEEADASDENVVIEDRQLQRLNVEFLLTVEDLLKAAVENLPQERLLVHYRSDHPRLIDFSNRAFYNGQLEAPPARMTASAGLPPIRYCQANGLYQHKTNRDEARKVIEVLRELWGADAPSASVGVVTFNLEQRDLIEDLIEKECHGDETFAARYQEALTRKDGRQDVGFFVKNLENVQGDERDVMIFSTTFGRKADGSFARQFGPLGQTHGERRLNVAVTRAKRQIIVVGSMPIEEVSDALGSAGAPGMSLKPRCYLQLYLAYARAVSAGDEEGVRRILDRLSHAGTARRAAEEPDSVLEEEVLEALKGMGYEVDCQVGESGFRIDVAVRHPNPDRGYLLGIECDGATYHADRAAHLRDVWRESILRDRGWKIHRIWSTRWWYHRAEEIQRLQEAIAAALQNHGGGPKAAEFAPLSRQEPPPVREAALRQKQAETSSAKEVGATPASKFDPQATLGQIRHDAENRREFKGSWELFLDFMELPRGIGLHKNMTLAEAFRLAKRRDKPM